MSQTPLITYSDILESLVRIQTASQDERVRSLARMAILDAYAEIPNLRNWKYYYARGRVTTDAEYSTGTVAYTHTGGANERQLTLSDGTWPDNAARGIVLIDSVEYHVDSRVSDSIVTLSVNSNPGADIAAGTSYRWWRDTYPMPLDFTAADQLLDHDNAYQPNHVQPGIVLNSRTNRQQSNEPMVYSFISDPDYVGAMAVMFEPPPNLVYNFDFMYKRHPLPLRTPDYHTGTVAVSSTTVTGTGTSWTDRMVGTVIRFPESGVTQVPTGLDGTYPFAEQRIVTAVDSTTSLTIDAVLSGSYDGVKYRISDYIDIDYAVMSVAFRKMCEYKFAENMSREDQGSRFRSYQLCLQTAKEQDGKRDISYVSPMPVRYYNRMRFGRDGGNSDD